MERSMIGQKMKRGRDHELTRVFTEETERQENGNGIATKRHKRARNGGEAERWECTAGPQQKENNQKDADKKIKHLKNTDSQNQGNWGVQPFAVAGVPSLSRTPAQMTFRVSKASGAKINTCNVKTVGCMKSILVLLMPGLVSIASAQVINSWTKATSGNWDQASSWSLGVLPNSSQAVMITNSGWKAVAINPSTPVNFPGSMTVSNLTVRGAWDTENVLLLNYFGTAVPLTVLNGLTLQDDGRIVNFNSGLVVQDGTVVITNATMIQDGGFVRVTNAQMNLSSSEYDLTNGVFEGGQVLLGYPLSARFNQYG